MTFRLFGPDLAHPFRKSSFWYAARLPRAAACGVPCHGDRPKPTATSGVHSKLAAAATPSPPPPRRPPEVNSPCPLPSCLALTAAGFRGDRDFRLRCVRRNAMVACLAVSLGF
ncbi:hypothetical protein GQ55_4G105700 [Panicum hallii var. hallii]|uniref:Uncharacterized protein n=1 Tax=Panicum hallii var. hallii TaxID=1504633 RepID=A0A2T7DX96_9POAL|nr:hypothetical protein GQ55_4G105700 [Panicum hallii var. hallii]